MDYDLKHSHLMTERVGAHSPALPLAQKRFALPANGGTAQGESRGTWATFLRSAWGTWQTHALALVDQAVVSGASFLTTVIIARWTHPSELGVYSLGISLVVTWLGIQESLISLPYTVYRNRPLLGPAEHAGSSLLHNWLLSALAILVMAAAALGVSASSEAPELVAPIWALVGLVPFALLREFARRFAFAHLHVGESLILDAAVGAMQLAGLGVLAWTGRLSATTAFAAIGAACALAGVMWLYLAREHFVMRRNQLREMMRQSWGLGKWLFANQLTLLVQGNVTYWLLTWIAGTTATGVYAACMSIALFANPLMMGLSNILAPRAAFALTEGGGAELRRQVIRDLLLLGAAMTLFCLVVLFAGDDVMRLLYHDKEYEGHGHTVFVLALAMLAMALGMPATGALTSIERPRELFWVSSFGAALTVVTVWCLVPEWGVLGAAYGLLAGNMARLAARWGLFLVLVPRSRPEPAPMRMGSDSRSVPLTRVLQQFTQSSEDRGWLIEQVDEGVQAKVYAVRSQNRQPIWQTYNNFLIKLYKRDAAPNVELVRAQFDSLSRLHAVLNGRTLSGWKTFTPAALFVCESPLALVMSEIPGTMLSLCLETGENVTSEVLESVPRAVVTAMETCWSMGQLHGDLHIDNILCDIVNRDISFIDLGVPANFSSLCDDVTKCWYPASHDLGFLLFNTAVRARSTIGKPGARLRQYMFVENVLRAFIETIDTFEDKQAALDEIHACARAHLRSLDLSLSPRGLWHLVLRPVASHRIDRLIARLKTFADAHTGESRAGMIARPSGIEPCKEKQLPYEAKPLAASARDVEQCCGPAGMLLGVFEVLDRAGIAYCVLHGYEGYPWRIKSDLDCIISSDVRPGRLIGLFHENSARIGGEVVHSRGYRLVLAGKNADGSPCFLTLDLSVDCELDDRPFYAGSEVIGGRRRHHEFWIPAADVEFGCYLVRKIAKGYLDKEQGQRLSYLYQQDAASCRRQVARFWGASSTALIVSAASSGNWEPVRHRLDELRAELRRRATLRSPWRVVSNRLRRLAERMMRICSPDGGLNVVFLGPDGAGKSSVIQGMGQGLAGVFARTKCYGFAPALFPRLFHRHRRHTPPGRPHGLPPRSFLTSVLRAVLYWFGYYTFGYYATVHPALARSTLVLHDRHLVDALVDPRRYRYGGPLWLLRLIWRFVPKPDLVILLDAPAEVLQARKQEVPFEETARQRDAYLLLIKTMKNGHVVDAARPLEEVIGNVNKIILRHLSRRIGRRFELEPTMPRPNLPARIVFRIVRDIKSAFGVESYLKNEDRRVLEQIIFPYFLQEDSYKDILFVGCHWYTKGYNERFEKKKSYWTIEIEPSRKRYGAKQHIVDGLQNLNKHFKPGALDLILCNGVFGWGLDAKADVEEAFRACRDCLREGGVLVVGGDDIEERRPFRLQECQGLRALKPFFFPPLGAFEYLTDTPYRHTFTFYVKQ